jgi:hypothetical protein
MRCHVIYDQEGKIVALASAAARELNYSRLSSMPAPTADQQAAELDVPEEHANLPLRELLERLEVNTTGERPTLRSQ